jgi:immune inhibitor A
MRRKLFSVLAVTMMLVTSVPAAASAALDLPDYRPVDVGPELRAWEPTLERISGVPENLDAAEAEAMAALSGTPYTDCVVDAKFWLYLDDSLGFYDFSLFYLVAQTDGSELWVQEDLSWPAGDPRPTPEITCEQAAYMLDEFDNNMYPIETDFFGAPDFHDGSLGWLDTAVGLPDNYWFDASGRQVVLVSNVRDDAYYDSTYPNYIAGFFSPSFEDYMDRNIMSIDAFDWADRTGPDGSRPFLYEGVFAHEYQHLLHSDYDPDEESFINEGMSDYAMVLTGYGESVVGHLEDAADYPENSLVVWGDQGGLEILTDYGHAFLFQTYLSEQYGQSFIQDLFHNPDNSITGINGTLDDYHGRRDFADIYHDFSVAMLIDTRKPGREYEFKTLDFNLNIGTPSAPNPEAFSTPGAPPWGGDYVWVTGNPKKFAKLTFNGLDYSIFPTAWTSDGAVLWSGQGDLLDNWAIFGTTGGGTLSFDTSYEIEEFWDFGFVQVSTDGGYTWTSLANASTTDLHDANTHQTVIANLPGLTGSSGGWVNMSFDLSAYAGQDILVAFRYVTDWSFSESGWLIDNVTVDGNLISDGSDASVFQDITELLPINNDFTVTFVAKKGSGHRAQYQVMSLRLDEDTEDGRIELGKLMKWCDSVVMIVTYDAAEGVSFYADYTYEITYKKNKPWSWSHHSPVHGHGHGTHFDRGHGHDD